MLGVIQGSKTNQPPRLTPRTFSPPKLNFSALLSTGDDGVVAGAAVLDEASKAVVVAAAATFQKPMVSIHNTPAPRKSDV